jgi:hypothetical protein
MNITTTQRRRGGGSRAHPCAFCGLPTNNKTYPMPELEVRGSHGRLLERQDAGPWPICCDCDALVCARDAPGLSGRIVPLLASRTGRPLSAAADEHVKARHQAFFAALPLELNTEIERK